MARESSEPLMSLDPGADSRPEAIGVILAELRELRAWLLARSPGPVSPSGISTSPIVPDSKARYKYKQSSQFFENRVQVEHILKEYFDEEEAAEYLRASPETIRRYARRKLLPFHQVGRRPVFSRADLDAFMRRQRRALQWPSGPERRTG